MKSGLSFIVFSTFIYFVSITSYANKWDYKNYARTEVILGNYEQNALIGLSFTLKSGWKIYNNQKQDLGFPTNIIIKNRNNISDVKIIYPKAEKFNEIEGSITYGYKNNVIFPIEIISIDPSKNINAIIEVNFALCNQVCIPVTEEFNFSLEPKISYPDNIELINKYKSVGIKLLNAIIIAICAGFIFNFMPCVLPVLFLKIMSLLEKRKSNKMSIIVSSLATISGIIFSFFVLSVVVIMLKFLGHNLGWGIQFQEPLFIGFLILILVIFSCNILGYFEVILPNNLLNKFNKLGNNDNKILRNFSTGVLATLLATPCSAPFLGSAISFALLTNYINIIMIFISIGIGLSLPYILLIMFPQILSFLPKPGNWMIKLKKVMSALLLITILWLIIVIKDQIGIIGTIIVFMEVVFLFQLIRNNKKAIHLVGRRAFVFLLLISSIFLMLVIFSFKEYSNKNVVANSNSLSFANVSISELLKTHNGVLVDVTADWCLTCKFNEFFILNSQTIKDKFAENDIVIVVADYTNKSPEIHSYLKSFNRFAIPTYVFYNKIYPQGKLLGELITINQLVNIIDENKN